jgi:hypothetical protein
MAAIPREETARLIDRCWAAACEEGRRISNVNLFVKKNVGCGEVQGEGDTRTSFVYFDHPTHVCESNCNEATYGTGADYDNFFCHGGSGMSFAGMA